MPPAGVRRTRREIVEGTGAVHCRSKEESEKYEAGEAAAGDLVWKRDRKPSTELQTKRPAGIAGGTQRALRPRWAVLAHRNRPRRRT